MGRVPEGRGWAGAVAVVSRMVGAVSVPTRRPHPPPFRVQLLCLIGESFGEHSQEVCGLRWAPDGRHLASGGNDNLVNVWPSAPGEGGWVPLQTFTQHQGAVKVRVGLG